MKITVGNYTRKYGYPLTYDVSTRDGADRFSSRIYDMPSVTLSELVFTLKDYPRQNGSVVKTIANIHHELLLRQQCAK